MADYYTLLTNAGIAYETACKAAGIPIKLAQISVGDGNGAVYNPDASAQALKREVWRGPLNALFQDEKNANWLMAEVTIPSDVGGWYVREAGLWTDTGILYAIVKYPESYKPVLATSGSGKEFYIRSIFETSNAAIVTLLIDDTVVKATRAWVMDYLAQQLAKGTYSKAEIEALIAKASALPVGAMVPFPLGKVPPGYLELDNSLFKDDLYPDLAAYLAKKFNLADDAAGYTRLPESRGEFFRGWDNGRGVDVGRVLGSLQADQFKSHTHGIKVREAAAGGGFTTLYPNGTQIPDDSFIQSEGGAETRPRNLAVMWCIKAWNASINQGNIDVSALALELKKIKALFITSNYKKLSVSSTGTNAIVTLRAEKLVVGSGNAAQALGSVDLSVNLQTSGLGGLDTGAVAASSCYGIWVATNGDAMAAVAALMPVVQGATKVGSPIITGLSSTASLRVGMTFCGVAFPWGVTIKSIDSATQITSSQPAVTTIAADYLRFVYEPVLPAGYMASRFSTVFTDATARDGLK